MNKELRSRLEARQKEEIIKAAGRLLNDPNTDITKSFHLVKAYSKLLSLINPSPIRERIWALSVGICCVFFAGLLMLPLRRTNITFNIRSEAVAIMLANSLSWEGTLDPNLNLLRIERLTGLHAPALGLNITCTDSDGWIQIIKGNASLTHLNLREKGFLELSRTNSGTLNVSIKGTELNGKFGVTGSEVALSAAAEMNVMNSFQKELKDIKIPEIVNFHAKGDGAVPTQFKIRIRAPLIMKNMMVRGVAFAKEVSEEPGNVSVISTIAEGNLVLHDSNNETLSLHKGDHLILEGIEGRVSEVKAGEEIVVTFAGTVKKVKSGPKGFEHDHTPSYLAYLYYNQRLALLWSAVVFLWSILWSFRKTIFT